LGLLVGQNKTFKEKKSTDETIMKILVSCSPTFLYWNTL